MDITNLELDGVKLILPDVILDSGGYVINSYNLDMDFSNEYHYHSCENVIRGLYLPIHCGSVRIVRVVSGMVWYVVVDCRVGSPTFGKWIGENLSASNYRQLYVPSGFAHGFCTLSSQSDVLFRTDDEDIFESETIIDTNDNELAIEWPVKNPIRVAEEDSLAVSFDVLKTLIFN
jgi:dTDP-4-dehydrorhamnose 3,5-epimerase